MTFKEMAFGGESGGSVGNSPESIISSFGRRQTTVRSHFKSFSRKRSSSERVTGVSSGDVGTGDVRISTGLQNASDAALKDQVDLLRVDSDGNVIMGQASLGTSADRGFFYTQSCAGAPTGIPVPMTGRVPTVVDTTNDRAYFFYSNSWHYATLT